jgi:hypothetical protein
MPTKVFDAFTRLDASDVNGYLVNRTIRNVIINGGFDIWQRGTTFNSVALAAYGPDRWNIGGASATVSQQSTGAPAGSRFYVRTTSTAANGACDFIHYIESANIAELRGKQATYQVKLRRNATMNVSLTVRIDKSVTLDAGSGATWVTMGSSVVNNGDMPTGTTSNDWLTRSLTVTIPNDGTANSVRVLVFQTAVITSGMSWDLAQVQLEEGAVDNDFRRNGNSIQGELAACQRYYYRIGGKQLFQFYGNGYGKSATAADMIIPFPVELRAQPTVSSNVTSLQLLPDGINVTSISADTNVISSQVGAIQVNAAGGLTLFRPYSLRASLSLTPFIEFIAEL